MHSINVSDDVFKSPFVDPEADEFTFANVFSVVEDVFCWKGVEDVNVDVNADADSNDRDDVVNEVNGFDDANVDDRVEDADGVGSVDADRVHENSNGDVIVAFIPAFVVNVCLPMLMVVEALANSL
ncbi:hypothetical protein HDU76_003519 [Blyttiomyces sp. JEL0837]|nr:hypothetical protein HDU76_003519 [Blyttiomyces sp. JEL0837]